MTQVHNKAGELVNSASTVSASVDANAAVSGNINLAVAAAAGLVLVGYSCRESAGSPAAAAFNITIGSPSGTEAVHVELAANASETKFFGDAGISAAAGISIEDVSGTYDISIYYKEL